jgi:hypothetical protein
MHGYAPHSLVSREALLDGSYDDERSLGRGLGSSVVGGGAGTLGGHGLAGLDLELTPSSSPRESFLHAPLVDNDETMMQLADGDLTGTGHRRRSISNSNSTNSSSSRSKTTTRTSSLRQLHGVHDGEASRSGGGGLPYSASSVNNVHTVLPYCDGPAPYAGPVEHLGTSLISVSGPAPYQDAEFAASWPEAAERGAYRMYGRRWWVLFVFCMLALVQSLVWISFSPITALTRRYYDISEAQVDLLLNWGTIGYLVVAPFAAKWGSTPQGLRRLMLTAAWLVAAAVVLRLIPELIYKDRLHPHALYFLHVAQILNACACPPISVTVTKLSNVWFDARQRTAVTSVAIMMNNAGSAIGFLLGPALVKSPRDMPHLLFMHAGLGLFTLVAALAYLPAVPPTHPSPAAADMYRRPPAPFFPALKKALRQRHFMLLSLCVGSAAGVFNVFVGILSTILPETRFTSTRVGWYSCAATSANIAGGVLTAMLAQRPRWRARLKRLIVALLAAGLVCAVWFALSLPSIVYDHSEHHSGHHANSTTTTTMTTTASFSGPHFDDDGLPIANDEPMGFVSYAGLIPSTPLTVGLSITLLGWCVGAMYPIAFELALEITYPLSESVSAGLLSTFQNAVGIAFLFVAPSLSGAAMNATLVFTMALAAALMPCVKESYARQGHEAQAKAMAERLRLRQQLQQQQQQQDDDGDDGSGNGTGRYSRTSSSAAMYVPAPLTSSLSSSLLIQGGITPGGTIHTPLRTIHNHSHPSVITGGNSVVQQPSFGNGERDARNDA